MGFKSSPGARVCERCGGGEVSDEEGTGGIRRGRCVDCGGGTFGEGGGGECEVCGEGYWAPEVSEGGERKRRAKEASEEAGEASEALRNDASRWIKTKLLLTMAL